jgi:long-chain acyl-CoA synthetase
MGPLERIERLRRFADRPAYLWREGVRWRRRSYAEVHAGVLAAAAALRAAGLGRGDPILIQGPDEPDWIEALLATFLAGGVAVPLEASTADDFRGKVAATVEARLLVASPDIAPPAGVRRIDLGSWRTSGASGAVARVVGAGAGAAVAGATPPDDAAAPVERAEIVFTSGTTGEPKGVVLTHDNLASDFAPFEEAYRRYERWIEPLGIFNTLSTLPLSHMFGQALNVFLPLYMGLTVALVPPRPRDILDASKRLRAWALFSVPRLLELLAAEVRREAGNAAAQARLDERLARGASKPFWAQRLTVPVVRRTLGWRFTAVVSGGAALADPVREFWERTGVLVIQGYGLTETAPIVSVSNPFRRGRGNVGRPLRGQEVRLGPDGEIQVRGANVTAGYYGHEADPSTSVGPDDGWFGTGDVGEIDAEGRIAIKGRIKDVIVTPEGENVYASDVEAAFQSLSGVRDVAVFGVPHATGEHVHAALLLNPSADAAEIVRTANAKLLPKQKVRDWTVWPEADLPRTSTGKVKRAALRAQVISGGGGGGAPGGAGGAGAPAAARDVRRLIARVARQQEDRIQEDARLVEDLGLASLDLVEVAAALEQEFGLTLAEDRMAGITVGELEAIARDAISGVPAAGRTIDARPAVAAPQGSGTAPGTGAPEAPTGPLTEAVAEATGAVRIRGSLRMPRWARSWPAHFNRRWIEEGLQRPIVYVYGRPEIEGRERLAGAKPPYLFVANHHSYFDTALLRSTLPLPVRGRIAPAMTTRYHRVFFGEVPGTLGRYLVESLQARLTAFFFNAFPLPETAGFRRSLVYAGELMDAGFSILIFPEGRHIPEGTMDRFRGGIGVFARDLRAPIVPVHLTGTHFVLPDERYWPHFARTRIVYGDPLEVPPDADPQEITRRLEAAVRDLNPGFQGARGERFAPQAEVKA